MQPPVFRWYNYYYGTWEGQRITPLQAELLLLLYMRKGEPETVSHEEILNFLYDGPDGGPDRADKCLEQFIHQIKVKFGPGIIIS